MHTAFGSYWILCALQLLTDASVQRDHAWIKHLSDRLVSKINAKVPNVVRNGDVHGYPGCVNLSFAYVEGESLLMALKVRDFAAGCDVVIMVS